MQDLNLIAPINTLGYGVATAGLLKAAAASGTRVSLWPLGPIDCNQEDRVLVTEAEAGRDSYNRLAPCLRIWHQFDMAQFVGKGVHAGYSFFELDKLTAAEKHHLTNLDVALVSSQWAKGVLHANNVSYADVKVVPLGVDTSIFHPDVPEVTLGNQVTYKTTVFLNCGKWEVRKGHDFVIQAFNAAFQPQDDVALVMACFNPVLPPEHSEQWRQHYLNSTLGRAGKVIVLEGRLPTQQHMASLMAAADCGFFPARAEGWNLEAAEMFAMGKRVILTNYSAHTEYLHRAYGDQIDITDFEDAYDGVFFHGGVGQWASLGSDQLEQSVSHLRAIHILKQNGKLTRNEAGIETFRHDFTWDNAWRATSEAIGGD